MCGFVGIFSRRERRVVTAPELERMVGLITHRGPDGERLHVEPGVGLAFCRLAIVDVEGGMQPLCNEDEDVWLVFNGEIYNHDDLRRELAGRGHRFRSRCDSEVIVHAYEEWGQDCPRRLRGIFAFGVWDRRRRELFLATDHTGVKPLLLLRHGDEVRFASEAKAFFGDPAVPRALDLAGVFDKTSGPGHLRRTSFQGVWQLKPGHSLLIGEEREEVRRYWRYEPTLDLEREGVTEATIEEALRDKLDEVVRLQLMSDVPLGAYLSGGVDSSAIVSRMALHHTGPFTTYTTSFSSSPSEDPRHSKMLTDHLGLQARFVECAPARGLEALPYAAWVAERPVNLADVARLQLARAARQDGVKVILTGQGIDEVLTGYHPGYEQFVQQELRRLAYGMGVGATFLAPDRLRELFFGGEATRESAEAREAQLVASVLARDLDGLNDALLRFEDTMGMGASVEVRVPMLDHELLELCAAIPQRLRPALLSGKRVLRGAVRDWVPAPIRERRKFAFNAHAPPLIALLDTPEGESLRELISPRALRERGYFDPEVVARAVSSGDAGGVSFVIGVQLLDQLFVTGFDPARFRGGGASLPPVQIGASGVEPVVADDLSPDHRPILSASIQVVELEVAPGPSGPAPTGKVVFRLAGGKHVRLTRDAWRVLDLCDGARTYHAIARELGGGNGQELLPFARRLQALGILRHH